MEPINANAVEGKYLLTISCPRCKSENIKAERKEMPVGGKTLTVTKYNCSDCDTSYYFEEQIVTYLVLKSTEKKP